MTVRDDSATKSWWVQLHKIHPQILTVALVMLGFSGSSMGSCCVATLYRELFSYRCDESGERTWSQTGRVLDLVALEIAKGKRFEYRWIDIF